MLKFFVVTTYVGSYDESATIIAASCLQEAEWVYRDWTGNTFGQLVQSLQGTIAELTIPTEAAVWDDHWRVHTANGFTE